MILATGWKEGRWVGDEGKNNWKLCWWWSYRKQGKVSVSFCNCDIGTKASNDSDITVDKNEIEEEKHWQTDKQDTNDGQQPVFSLMVPKGYV